MIPTIDPSSIHLYRPPPDSHKGQNGRLLVIGGSKLFHSSIFWAADVASRIVDLVHFTSPANENNELVRKKLKDGFWNGIVVDWRDVEHYIEEDDAIVIGPGMIRDRDSAIPSSQVGQLPSSLSETAFHSGLNEASSRSSKTSVQRNSNGASVPSTRDHLIALGQNDRTSEIVNFLLKKYPSKRWVVDGGALQEVEPTLLTESCIITPHRGEFERLLLKLQDQKLKIKYQKYKSNIKNEELAEIVKSLSNQLNNCTIVLKGPTDIVCQRERCAIDTHGNPGMTKGGTGDVLAGLIGALYCKNDSWTAATTGIYTIGKAAETLYERVGVYYNAQDLLNEIPLVLRSLVR